jgi:hypothetical protein
MRVPDLSATIERRLLISYAVEPEFITPLLPATLRPQLINGKAVAGICIIRLADVRPTFIKPKIGWGGENAAHRIAVEYEDNQGITQTGVFIPERHSSSLLPVLAGGRIFPGKHTHARFNVKETNSDFSIDMTSADDSVSVKLHTTEEWSSRLFNSLDEASAFYQSSPVGWSPTKSSNKVEGLQLFTNDWKVKAGKMVELHSSYFDAFPKDAVIFDHVLIMQNVPVIWGKPQY